jgi:predicted metal-dependent enzyme (double-stranded beta helix superfamily)
MARDHGLPNRRDLSRLSRFVKAMATLVDAASDRSELLARGSELLAALVGCDDWLPDEFARPDELGYRQYLLHCDSRAAFCVVSFVWGPGQSSPIHDHRTWGLVGVLRGAESVSDYVAADTGPVASGPARLLRAGSVEAIDPAKGDLHRVSNADAQRPSVSIHVYGADIGSVARSIFHGDGTTSSFQSGYDNTSLPNIWGTR